MILRPARHKLRLSFDREYEQWYARMSARLIQLRKLRNEAVSELILKCYPFLLPLQLLIYFSVSKRISLIITFSYFLGVFLFYLCTEVIYTVKENRHGQ
jgi:hypothetical protein